jgi:hypothetical protein
MGHVLTVSKVRAKAVIARLVQQGLISEINKNINNFIGATKGIYSIANKFTEDLTAFVSDLLQVEIIKIEKAIYHEVI